MLVLQFIERELEAAQSKQSSQTTSTDTLVAAIFTSGGSSGPLLKHKSKYEAYEVSAINLMR